jgi:hypothetical protein
MYGKGSWLRDPAVLCLLIPEHFFFKRSEKKALFSVSLEEEQGSRVRVFLHTSEREKYCDDVGYQIQIIIILGWNIHCED